MTDCRHIAIVDDEPSITRMLTFLIQRSLGMSTWVFNDSSLALRELPADPDRICLAICDLRMPEVDGLQLCRRLREAGARYPILLLTAYASEDLEEEARRIGVDSIVQKPFHPPEFTGRLRAMLANGGGAAPDSAGAGPAAPASPG